MLKLTVLVLATVLSACTAQRLVFNFDPYTLLTCYSPSGAEVPPPFIPLQPGPPYQPVLSGFESPVFGPMPQSLQSHLLNFLGPDYNDKLTSVGDTFPLDEPVLPSSHLPLTIPPVSSGNRFGNAGVGQIYMPFSNLTAEIRAILDTLNSVIQQDYPLFIDVIQQLNSRCDVMAVWVKLPEGQFFPQWVSASVCATENNTCSLPPGLTCQPVLLEETLVKIIVLRWDCCWNIVNRQWRWECGWRRTFIPFITRCACSCFPVKHPYSHTGRIGGMFQTFIDDLNT